jgi:hypothetical protein
VTIRDRWLVYINGNFLLFKVDCKRLKQTSLAIFVDMEITTIPHQTALKATAMM